MADEKVRNASTEKLLAYKAEIDRELADRSAALEWETTYGNGLRELRDRLATKGKRHGLVRPQPTTPNPGVPEKRRKRKSP